MTFFIPVLLTWFMYSYLLKLEHDWWFLFLTFKYIGRVHFVEFVLSKNFAPQRMPDCRNLCYFDLHLCSNFPRSGVTLPKQVDGQMWRGDSHSQVFLLTCRALKHQLEGSWMFSGQSIDMHFKASVFLYVLIVLMTLNLY